MKSSAGTLYITGSHNISSFSPSFSSSQLLAKAEAGQFQPGRNARRTPNPSQQQNVAEEDHKIQ